MVQKPRLTKRQRALIAEIKELLVKLNLDPDVLALRPEARTTRLELAKDQILRSSVILQYVLMDEQLNSIICWHFFGKKRRFQQLWKTQRFKAFNYFVLEKLYLQQKLDLVRYVDDIPKWVAADLSALNDLRNAIAHSFFPENRRRKPQWKGQSVFTKAGFDRFSDDMDKLEDYFWERYWSGSPEDTGNNP
jgi:hypothetical protein